MDTLRTSFAISPTDRTIDQPGNKYFVLALAQALHGCGTPVHRLEDVIQAVCEALEIQVQCFATPTCLFISSHRGTEMIRVDPGAEDLERMVAVDRVAAGVARGTLTAEAGHDSLDALSREPSRYGAGATVTAFGLASAAVGVLFGRTATEAGVSLALGLGVGLLAVKTGGRPALARLFEGLAAAAAGVAASLLAVVVPLEPRAVTLTAVIILVPGFTLTVAMSELATGHLAAGTARAAKAGMAFLQLGLGAAVGWRLLDLLPVLPPPEAVAWGPETEALALLVASSAVAVLLKVRPRDWLVALAAATVAFYGSRLGGALLGGSLGALVGALGVGLLANLQSRLRDVPAAVAATPGILLLVPGSLGFRGVDALLQQQTLIGVGAAFETFLVGASLVGGLLLAHALLPPGRAL
jgi:uncharacterized membrane protein YjjP (DUF1212 family)